MVVRLLLILVVTLAGVAGLGESVEPVSAVEVGESLTDLDEAQVAVTLVEAASTSLPSPRARRDTCAPITPLVSGIFRPPRAAFV
jgi:hypothetical protein